MLWLRSIRGYYNRFQNHLRWPFKSLPTKLSLHQYILFKKHLFCVCTHIWSSEEIFRSWFSPPTMWVLRTEFKSSDLAVSTYTNWIISQAPNSTFTVNYQCTGIKKLVQSYVNLPIYNLEKNYIFVSQKHL